MKQVKKLVVLGGGSAGWIAASAISDFFKSRLEIVLVESERLGIIGVGEATIPPLMNFIRGIGVNEIDFIKATQATFKLGIKFVDWKCIGDAYFHQFGPIGHPLHNLDFYQYWLRAREMGNQTVLTDYSPSAVLAKHNKFIPQQSIKPGTPFSHSSYALHFDAGLVADYLRKHAEGNGVKRREGEVVDVVQNKEDGSIDGLILADGDHVAGDFFIDCSGFSARLIEKVLRVDYEEWKKYLPCDRAVAVQTENADKDIKPYTTSTAREFGWTWHIPLQHRSGNGYVFDGDHCSDEKAIATLLGSVQGKVLSEARVIPFKTGVRKRIWEKNCLSLGLASGFLEPLESTAIHLVTRGLQFFLRMFNGVYSDKIVKEYNSRMRQDYLEIRDFIILHYCETKREDTEFWRYCASMGIPDTLVERLELFRAGGILKEGVDELFRPPSWHAVCTGMGVFPERTHPVLDEITREKIEEIMLSVRQPLEMQVQQYPTHHAFINQYCRAEP